MNRKFKRRYLVFMGVILLCLLMAATTAGAVSLQNEGADCAGETLVIDLLSQDHTVQLTAAAEDAGQGVTWRSSDKSKATVSEDGLVTGLKNGTVTITATSAGDAKDKASCKVKVTSLAKEINVSGDDTVVGGKKVTLKAEVLPKEAASKKVTWESADPEAATVSSTGIVSAKKTDEPKAVTMTAAAQDGSGVTAEWIIIIFPAAQEACLMYDGEDCTAETLLIDLLSGVDTVQLNAGISPAGAKQAVTWRSSKKSVAAVSENGLVTGLKKGTVTITATCADNSKVKAACKVTVTNLVKEIHITGESTVVGGKSTTLKAEVLPGEADSKKITWESSDPEIATVSAKGVVKTQKADEMKTVTITATATDGSGVLKQHVIAVVPAVQEVSLLHEGADCTQGTLTIDLASEVDTLQLGAAAFPAAADQAVTWQSSDESVATVSEDGTVTGHRKGTATISATSVNGENAKGAKIKAICNVKVTYLPKSIQIIGPDTLTAGEKVTYEADILPEEVGKVQLGWTLWEIELNTDPQSDEIESNRWICPENIATINNELGIVTVKENITGMYNLLLTVFIYDDTDDGFDNLRARLYITVLPN